MKRGAIISGVLHFLVIAFAYFGLPNLFETPKVQYTPPMSVDIIMKEEKQKKNTATLAPKVLPKTVKLKKQQEKQRAPSIPKPLATPKPLPRSVVPEEKASSKPLKMVVAPLPKIKPKIKKVKKPQNQRLKSINRIAPKPKRKPANKDEFGQLLKDLTKRKKSLSKPVYKKSKSIKSDSKSVEEAYSIRQAENALVKLVRKQVVPCWHIPGGAKDVQKMKISVRIKLGRDGKLLAGFPKVIDKFRFKTDKSFRVVAESALRALHRCSPLKLPYREYEFWNDITFNFDPSEALGR